MGNLINYKGLAVLDPVNNPGGQAIADDMREMADRAGPVHQAAGNPTVDDDSAGTAGNGEFFVWSKWLNTGTNKIYMCADDTVGAAVWLDITGSGGGGSGDVTGPASSTDNAVTRFDGATGKLLQNSILLLADDGQIQIGTSGNARGARAVDLQAVRTSATQVASGDSSFIAGGQENTASGYYSLAQGWGCTASNSCSHAEGRYTTASGTYAHSEGRYATSSGNAAHAEGNSTTASGDYSHTEGELTAAYAKASHSEGIETTCAAAASGAHAEGKSTTASGVYAHAEGSASTASGYSSHAEGYNTTASGAASHAEGLMTTASGEGSHAEGFSSTASTNAAHAEGVSTTASGYGGHAEGASSVASAYASNAGGVQSKSHLRGQWARASGGHSLELGTAQATVTLLFRRTTDATATTLTLDGNTPSASNRFTILDGQTVACIVNIVGRKENGAANDHAMFLRQVLIRREGSTTQLVGSVQTVGTDINPATWGGVAITADNTNEALQINVTGLAATNIRWTATVSASEAADAAI